MTVAAVLPNGAADKANPHYVKAISMNGIDPYYGWHLADAIGPDYADVISFVKGNDFFPGGRGGERALRLAFSFVSPDEIADGVSVLGSLVRAAAPAAL